MINFIDGNRQWFKSKVVLDVTEEARRWGLYLQCFEQPDVMIIPDTCADERSRANPVVIFYPYVRFYAGAPLITPKGHAIGTLYVVDDVPRELSSNQMEALRALSRQIVSQLELRRTSAELAYFNY